MKVSAYLQLVPRRTRSGAFNGVVIKSLSQKCPGQTAIGAHLVHIELDIPNEAFFPTKVTASIPLEKLTPQVAGEVKP